MEYIKPSVHNIDHPESIGSWNLNPDKSAYEKVACWGRFKITEEKTNQHNSCEFCPYNICDEIIWF